MRAEIAAAIPGHVQKWIKIGLSCEPANWEASEEAIAKCYAYAGLKRVPYIKVSSPCVLVLASQIAAAIINHPEDGENNTLDAPIDVDRVDHQVFEEMKKSPMDGITQQMQTFFNDIGELTTTSPVKGLVYDAVKETVMAVKPEMSEADIEADIEKVIASNIDFTKFFSNYYGGRVWVGYLAYMSFFLDICDVDIDDDIKEKIKVYTAAQINSWWWYPDQDFVMVCDTPEYIDLDDNRLHSPGRLAIKWRDGWGLAFWKGVNIPNAWIENKPSAQEVLRTDNIEVRRAGCELIGWVEILKELNAVLIDAHKDPKIGELYEAELPDSGYQRFLKVLCGTGRTFAIPVPPEMQYALQANAWTYGIDEGWENFKVAVRT